MGMAGWHLIRNKMLFFGGALFISLAAGVHLTLYDAISSLSSSPSADHLNRDSYISFLHRISFLPRNSTNSSSLDYAWSHSHQVLACDFQRLSPSDASDLLNGSCVVVAGGSQARLVAYSLLGLIVDSEDMEAVRADLFKRHNDYRIVIGMKLNFIWAPYVSNLTGLTMELKRDGNVIAIVHMFTNKQRQEERIGRYGTPRVQYLQELVTQFQNATNEETKERIAANLANFAYDPYNYNFLRQLNVLELFLDCITEPNEKLVEFGIGGICNSCVDPENAAVISSCGGIPLIIQCLSSPVRNTVNYAIGSLYYMCNEWNREEILSAQVVDVIQRYAAAASVNVTFSHLAKAFLDKHVSSL